MNTRKITRVMLIVPPNTAVVLPNQLHINMNKNFPLGIGYLAGVLEREGFDVSVMDALVEGWSEQERIAENRIHIGLSDERIKQRIAESGPHLVGISSLFTMQEANVKRVAALARQAAPEAVVVVGGAHPSAMPESIIQDPNVDFVIMGEGEERLPALIRALNTGKGLQDIDGIAYKHNGKDRVVPRESFVSDLDSIPFPARHLFDMNRYFGRGASHGVRRHDRFASVVTSRGCPAKCSFCTAHRVWGHRYRMRSPENVVEELEGLISDYGVTEILFEDDNLTMSKKRAIKLFNLMIERKLGLEWDTPNGVAVYALDESVIEKMKESGCHKINFAVESGQQRVLDQIINKPIKLKRVSELIHFAKKIGLEVGGFFVLGMPGETFEDMKETIRFIKRHRLHSFHLAVASPLPGSSLYDQCLKEGLLVDGYSPFNPPIIDYHIQTPLWSADELRRFVEKEKLKLQVYQQLINPRGMGEFLAKGPSYVLRKVFKLVEGLIRYS